MAGSPQNVGAQLDEAYQEVGFCQIINHDLDPDTETDAWAAAREFFGLPDSDKTAITIPDGQAYGYGPFQSERLAASLGVTTPPDLKETFSMGPLSVPSSIANDESAAFVFSPNYWPEAASHIRTAFEAHYLQLGALAERIMSALALSLDLDANYFAPFIDRHTAALRALHYPELNNTPGDGQLRAGAHADYGTLTLLRQDDAPGGLEVLGLDQSWHPVASVPGAYVVNIGDALARWSNNRWQSTIHRVAVPNAEAGTNERFSMAYFHNANWDAVIEALPNCVSTGAEPTYGPITAGEHLMNKFRSTQ